MSTRRGGSLEVATAIGETLCAHAYWHEGRCNWIGRKAARDARAGGPRVVHAALGCDLYEGTAGIGLFLARLYVATGRKDFREHAAGAIRQALSSLEHVPEPLRFGLYAGRIGVLYASAEVSRAIDDIGLGQACLDTLQELASDLEPHHFLDVGGGNAGAIPALIHIHDVFADEGALRLAKDLAEELLLKARRRPSGWSWPDLPDGGMTGREHLTGFFHGAAGIGYGLLELYVRTGSEELRCAAEEAFRFENHRFDQERGNWPDYRYEADASGAQRCSLAWCHGAPGIGFSRLRAFRLTADPAHLADARTALRATAEAIERMDRREGWNDASLCHGALGLCELLLYASEVLDEREHLEAARRFGDYGRRRYGGARSWPCGIDTREETPGLLLGLAGVGYSFLRQHDPVRTPPVMIVEPGRDQPGRLAPPGLQTES